MSFCSNNHSSLETPPCLSLKGLLSSKLSKEIPLEAQVCLDLAPCLMLDC